MAGGAFGYLEGSKPKRRHDDWSSYFDSDEWRIYFRQHPSLDPSQWKEYFRTYYDDDMDLIFNLENSMVEPSRWRETIERMSDSWIPKAEEGFWNMEQRIYPYERSLPGPKGSMAHSYAPISFVYSMVSMAYLVVLLLRVRTVWMCLAKLS